MKFFKGLFNKNIAPFSYFVTTPIFYVNAEPHIGHLHTLLVSDALHRFYRLKGVQKTIFSSGTDEHGLKIQRMAESCNMEPLDFCNQISQKFRSLCDTFDISLTNFIRTTDPRHMKSVQHFWKILSEKGFIYKSTYGGWYSVPDESFVVSSEIEERLEGGEIKKFSSLSGHKLEWCEEENYMFKLSSFTEQLQELMNSKPSLIRPENFLSYVNNILDKGLNDISVSRPLSRLKWGIPVPGDDSQRIYVWLDALVNYLTVSGYPDQLSLWPPNCHVIGKDIIRFHAIFWPAFLMAAGLKTPQSIVCHGHWRVDGVKMSKSLKNVVNPLDIVENFSIEGVRYFFLRFASLSIDADFNLTDMKNYINGDLANTIGNCLARVSAPTINKEQIFPETPSSSELRSLPRFEDIKLALNSLRDQVDQSYEEGNFCQGIVHILECVHHINKLLEEVKPWIIVKEDPKNAQLTAVIYISLEALRLSAILLQPIVPFFSARILDKLNVSHQERLWSYATPCLGQKYAKRSRPLCEKKIIAFQRLK